jgi:hypothetical protein
MEPQDPRSTTFRAYRKHVGLNTGSHVSSSANKHQFYFHRSPTDQDETRNLLLVVASSTVASYYYSSSSVVVDYYYYYYYKYY